MEEGLFASLDQICLRWDSNIAFKTIFLAALARSQYQKLFLLIFVIQKIDDLGYHFLFIPFYFILFYFILSKNLKFYLPQKSYWSLSECVRASEALAFMSVMLLMSMMWVFIKYSGDYVYSCSFVLYLEPQDIRSGTRVL